jgi:hypothetical protein
MDDIRTSAVQASDLAYRQDQVITTGQTNERATREAPLFIHRALGAHLGEKQERERERELENELHKERQRVRRDPQTAKKGRAVDGANVRRGLQGILTLKEVVFTDSQMPVVMKAKRFSSPVPSQASLEAAKCIVIPSDSTNNKRLSSHNDKTLKSGVLKVS